MTKINEVQAEFRKPTLRDRDHVLVAGMLIVSVIMGKPLIVVGIHVMGLCAIFALSIMGPWMPIRR